MGLIIREKEPHTLESPLAQIDSFLTPTELFDIRSHFTTPELDIASYKLRIDGAVRNSFSLTYNARALLPDLAQKHFAGSRGKNQPLCKIISRSWMAA